VPTLPTVGMAMDADEFVAITLRNPVHEAVAEELVRLALTDHGRPRMPYANRYPLRSEKL
jgi:hypothetical protein